jgi:hypothetical protein
MAIGRDTEMIATDIENTSTGEDGTEEEFVDDPEISTPFDPAKVRVDPKPITIDALCERMRHSEINLQPEFQRKSGLWTPEAQSRLIESILIRIPLPSFYIDASDDEEWLVIDGLQRLTIIKEFVVHKVMRLKKLEFLTDLNGMTYDQLHRKFQRRINETQIIIYSVQPGTPKDLKFNIFKRVNTGGKPLTPQEIRHAIYQGDATRLLERISESNEYQASAARISSARMGDRELILRYFTYMRLDPMNLQAETLDKRLNDTMDWLNELSKQKRTALQNKLFKGLRFMDEVFEKMAFRKPGAKAKPRVPPLNKPLFEAWTTELATLSDQKIRKLHANSKELKRRFTRLKSDEMLMEYAIKQGTGKPDMVKKRFTAIRRILQESLE